MRIPKLAYFNNKHFLALIGNVVIALVSVLTMSLLLRTMTKTDVGVWFLFLSVYGLADAVRYGFLTTGTVKFYAGSPPERANEVAGSVWVLAISVSLVLMAANLCLFPFMGMIKSEGTILIIKWFGITMLSSVVFNVTFWILFAKEDYVTILLLRSINSGAMIVILAIMAYFKKETLENVLIVNFLTNVLTSIVCIVLGHSKLETIVKRSRACIIELAQFGKYSMATNLTSNILGNANNFIITFMLGLPAVAVFSIPAKLMEIVEILLRTFVGTGMSGMAIAHNKGDMDGVTYISKKYAGMLTLLFIPIAIGGFFFADLAIWLLAGNKYAGTEAANIFRILLVMAIFYPIDRFNGVTLDIIHQPQVNFYKVIVMVTVNVVTTSLGIYLLKDVYGAALAAPFPLIAGLLFGYYYLKKHITYSFKGIIVTGYTEAKLLIAKGMVNFGLTKI